MYKWLISELRKAPAVSPVITKCARPVVDCPESVAASFAALTSTVKYTADLGVPIIATFSDTHLRDHAKDFQIVCQILWLFRSYFYAPVYIHLLFSPLLKHFPPRGQVIGKGHVNSGYTIHDEVIVVFRLDEWPKVFAHECLHYFRTEAGLHSKTFPFPPAKLYEAHCEVWARIINCALCSLATGAPLSTILERERLFAGIQLVKILDHSGFTLADFLSDSFDGYRENTNVFSYYVIAGVLLQTTDYARDSPDGLIARPDMLSIYRRVKKRLPFKVIKRELDNASPYLKTTAKMSISDGK